MNRSTLLIAWSTVALSACGGGQFEAVAPVPVEETTQSPAPEPADPASDPIVADFRTLDGPTDAPSYGSAFAVNAEGRVTTGDGSLSPPESGQMLATFFPPTEDEPGAIRLQAPGFGLDRTYSGWNPDQGGLVADGLTLVSTPLTGLGAELDHLHYGIWSVPLTDGGTYRAAIATGFETPATAMPTTGKLAYAGSLIGQFTSDWGVGTMLGDASLQVDFAAQQVERLDLAITYYGNASPSGSSAQLTFTDLALVDGRFAPGGASEFSYVGENGHVLATAGDVAGALYGPGAQEAGGVFSLTGDMGLLATGSFGASARP